MGPVVGQVPVSGLPGDKVNVSCSLLGSLPAPSLTWSVHNVCCHANIDQIETFIRYTFSLAPRYINKSPVSLVTSPRSGAFSPSSPVAMIRRTNNSDGVTIDTVISLSFSLQDDHFRVSAQCSNGGLDLFKTHKYSNAKPLES